LLSVSGGVTEALIRTLHYRITGKDFSQAKIAELRNNKDYREVKIKMGDHKLGFAVVSNVKLASRLIAEIKAGRDDLHFIEVMACPGGCINGGGQPIGTDNAALKSRVKTVYETDEKDSIRYPYKNPALIGLYRDFLGEPLGSLSLELLHTTYKKREVPL
jgi:iron only hydrogenase large subunit-like protein